MVRASYYIYSRKQNHSYFSTQLKMMSFGTVIAGSRDLFFHFPTYGWVGLNSWNEMLYRWKRRWDFFIITLTRMINW